MEPHLSVVASALVELDVPLNPDSLRNRALMQKAIYFAQESGINLGYSFAWHETGPYSEDLADDCFRASRTVAARGGALGKGLAKSYRERLCALKDILQPPAGSGVSKEDWYEWLASVHFLRHYAARDERQIEAMLRPRLNERWSLVRAAHPRLAGVGLANS